MPRGSGKTTIAEGAAVYAVATGRRGYAALVGATQQLALSMLESIKGELEGNDLLAADFPEVCHPIRALEGQSNRAARQNIDGRRTHVIWQKERIVLPTVAGSKASGAAIAVTGITGAVRGLKFRKRDGTIARPDLVIPDDIQTDRSARSASQCEQRKRVLNGTILGLAGPGKKMAALMPCTVICRGDLADDTLDRAKSPEWTGRRYQLIYEYPRRMDLWEQYTTIRADSLRSGGTGAEATDFYRANQGAMSEGARVAWAERKLPDDVDALQHAMNLRAANLEAFEAEYQNAPLEQAHGDGEQLDKTKLSKRNNNLDRGKVPLNATRITAFIDTSHRYLTYAVGAWSDTFDGALIDYGSYPDQQRKYFTKQNAQRTLQRAAPGAGLEGATLAGLEALVAQLLSREWVSESKAALRIERILIDANDGAVTDVVYNFCRRSAHAALLFPSHGKSITVTSKPWHEYQKRPGERLGEHWLIPAAAGKRAVKHVLIDVNYWKSFVAERLRVAPGDKGALTFFGKTTEAHDMLIDHLCSEFRKSPSWRGRTVDQWEIKPEAAGENDLWDAVVGCAVAASIQGAVLPATGEQPKPQEKGETWSERAKRKWAGQ